MQPILSKTSQRRIQRLRFSALHRISSLDYPTLSHPEVIEIAHCEKLGASLIEKVETQIHRKLLSLPTDSLPSGQQNLVGLPLPLPTEVEKALAAIRPS